MDVIPEDLVEETWQEVAGFSERRAESEMKKLAKRQSALMTFILEFTQDLDEEVKGLAIYMFFVVCRMFEKGSKKIKKISPNKVIKSYESVHGFMERLDGTHERFLERIATRYLSPQPYVMKYVVETLMEAPEDEDPVNLSDEDTGYLFMLFKAVVDVLHEASQYATG